MTTKTMLRSHRHVRLGHSVQQSSYRHLKPSEFIEVTTIRGAPPQVNSITYSTSETRNALLRSQRTLYWVSSECPAIAARRLICRGTLRKRTIRKKKLSVIFGPLKQSVQITKKHASPCLEERMRAMEFTMTHTTPC